MMLLRILFTSVAISLAGSAANAQITSQHLLHRYVDDIGQNYRDVDDAILMFQRKNGSTALDLLKKASHKDSNLPPGEVLYAHLCFMASQPDAGRAVLELAAVRHEDDPEPWVMLADLAMRGGRLAEALTLFEKGLMHVEGRQGSDKRMTYLKTACREGLARVEERRGRWKNAAVQLQHWMKLQPKNQSALERLAGVYIHQGKFEDARATLEVIRQSRKDQPLPEVVMGVIFQKMGRAAESEEMMREALAKGAEDHATRLAVAEWALTAGKVAMAKENAEAVLKLNPQSEQAKILTGRILRYDGDDAKAEAIFRETYDASPASFAASNELALAIFAQNAPTRHKQALQYAQVNISRYKDLRTPRGREAAATFAHGLHKIGQDAAAERIMQQVITSGEVSPQIGYFAAAIYKSRGRLDIARQVLDKSLSSYISFPEQATAKTLMDELSREPQAPATDAKAIEANLR